MSAIPGADEVDWLRQRSMLERARRGAERLAGSGAMWSRPYGMPDPRRAVETAGVWFTAYPPAMVTAPGQSFVGALGDPALWAAFATIGIDAVHSGPVKRAGGVRDRQYTATVDGHFDRISNEIDPEFGTEDEYRTACAVARSHGGIVIDDLVPAHTGKGPDFRLAEMGVGEYPGIFHMVVIDPADWHLLPAVAEGADSANLDTAAEAALERAGYIVGAMQRVIFQAPGVKETNWSATSEVTGPDGVTRRWVYLHYFKDGQPSINWLDPTCAGIRVVFGDALHSLVELGSGALRLDANGFLGVEKRPGSTAWSEGHPLSEAANHLVASMVRKVGGFTFQELNLTIDDIAETSRSGADLSYDFVNRPAYHHALATADTEFLRITLRAATQLGVRPIQLVHALQNHDELTYEMVHFETRHRHDRFWFRGVERSGHELAAAVRADLIERLTGPAAPYNALFTTNGIASTTASVLAAALGYSDLDRLTDEDIERIRRAHLVAAAFNAWQPGVFAVSGWDLCGMLPLPAADVAEMIDDGDTRWINRPAYDLLGHGPQGNAGMPRGRSLYGSLPSQLNDSRSFVARLASIIAVRTELGLATAEQVEVPDVDDRAVLAMVHRLGDGRLQMTVLNVATTAVSTVVRLQGGPMAVELDGLSATSLVLG